MAMIEVVTHDTDDLLRECILSEERLMLAEMAYPGYVRVNASGRYHVRVDVLRMTYKFDIKALPNGERELVGTFFHTESLLKELVWHRAAEAMLAHRRGHSDATFNKSLRKPKVEQDV